jgi:hypothetical protein
MFDEKEMHVILRTMTIAVYQLEKMPVHKQPDPSHMQRIIGMFSPRNASYYFLETSLLFDPPGSPEEAIARFEHYGVQTTIEDMRKMHPQKP